MSENRSTVQPTSAGVYSAADIKHRMAERRATEATEDLRHTKEQEEKQKAVMEELHKPFDRSAEQLMQVVMQLVSHTAERGQSEVRVYRFPNALCSDRGRSINNSARLGNDIGRPPQIRLRILA
jgi:hypothetical protein